MGTLRPFQLLVTTRGESPRSKGLVQRLAEASFIVDGGNNTDLLSSRDEFQKPPTFNAARFHSQLPSQSCYGSVILSAVSLPSTQSLLHQNSRQLPNGTTCVADVQASGQGRGGNTWTSPPGCLMFSIITRLDIEGTRLPFIQYLVSLALVEAIESQTAPLLGLPAGSGLTASIKWPNDVYCGGAKLGGILCNSVYRDKQFQVIIGVGLNVSNVEPTTCINTELRRQAQQLDVPQGASLAVDTEALLADVLVRLEKFMSTLQYEGFGPMEAAYTSAWLHSDQQVTVKGEGEEPDATVFIKGLTEEGYLLAEDDAGDRYALSPDGNRLDFFQGLIKKKLPPPMSDADLYVY